MKQMLGLVAMLCLSTQALAQSSDWDGTWAGSWGGQTAAKIIISEGNVLEYDYRGHLKWTPFVRQPEPRLKV